MNIEKAIERITSGELSRTEFLTMRDNAVRRLEKASSDEERRGVQRIIDACNNFAPEPLSSHYNFMGFCPSATFNNRQDIIWKKEGICRFTFDKSEKQMKDFVGQLPGDWIIMKKIQRFGETMRLYGFGQITARALDENRIVYYKVDWNKQAQEIEVPLLGCNATVNIRALDRVHKDMPPEFWQWLSHL